ncbi:MAG: type II toxin-antitoxin system HicA family toxin [Elusimicrobia bacterium]|nr:type II toxin-antitoxin system HicA family toxin [Elusimicrobiota bacterium]
MSKPPQLSGERVVRALKRAGFIDRPGKGSHVFLYHPRDPSRYCTVPLHGSKIVKRGTLKNILKGVRLSIEEFLELT